MVCRGCVVCCSAFKPLESIADQAIIGKNAICQAAAIKSNISLPAGSEVSGAGVWKVCFSRSGKLPTGMVSPRDKSAMVTLLVALHLNPHDAAEFQVTRSFLVRA